MRMHIPDDWDGETWKCWSVEWPDSITWNAYLRGFIDEPTKGRYWDERTGSVAAAQTIGREIWSRNSPMEEVLMTCNTETQELFERMAVALEALAARECCSTGGTGVFNSGSRGAGIVEEQPSSYEEDPSETPPPGFDTWAEYRAHKCNSSADIVLNLKTDLLSISNLTEMEESTFTAALTLLVGVLLTPVPYDDLAYVVGLLTVAAVEYSFLAQLSVEIQDNAENLICVIYTSPDAQAAQTNFRNEVNSIIDGMIIAEIGKDWLKDVVVGLTPFDSFNNPFTDTPTQSQDTDCSECGGVALAGMSEFNGCAGTIESGDFSSGVDTEVASCQSEVFGSQRANFVVVTTETGVDRHFEVIAVSGNNGGMILNWTSSAGAQPQEDWPQLDDIIGLTWDAVSMHFIRNTGVDDTLPFTITLRVTEV